MFHLSSTQELIYLYNFQLQRDQPLIQSGLNVAAQLWEQKPPLEDRADPPILLTARLRNQGHSDGIQDGAAQRTLQSRHSVKINTG